MLTLLSVETALEPFIGALLVLLGSLVSLLTLVEVSALSTCLALKSLLVLLFLTRLAFVLIFLSVSGSLLSLLVQVGCGSGAWLGVPVSYLVGRLVALGLLFACIVLVA